MSDRAEGSDEGFWRDGDVDERDRFRTLVDAVDDAMAVVNDAGRVVAVNGGVLEVSSADRSDLVGTHLSKLFVEADRARLERAIDGQTEDGDPRGETLELSVATDEGPVACELDLRPLVDEGSAWGTACVLREDRSAATATTGEAEDDGLAGLARTRRVGDSEFRSMLEHLDQVVWMATHDQQETIYVNQAFEDVYGRDREQLYDDPEVLLESIHPADRELVTTELDRDVTEPYEMEYRVVQPDGEVRWIHDSATPIFDDDGEVTRVVGNAVDVTQRREREQRLERSTSQLETLFEVLPVGVVVAEADGELVAANDVAHEIWGGDVFDATSVEEYEKYPVRWADSGEVVPAEEMTLARVLDGEVVTDPDVYVFDTYDDERRVVEVLGMPIRDETGEVSRGVITMNDVTEEHEAQQRLEESERRYRTLIENFPDGSVGMFDEDLRYTAVGGQLLDRLDVDPEDRLGRRLSEIHPEELFEQIRPYFEAALEGEANAFEIEYRGRSLRANVLPIEDASGSTFAGMLVVQDVTERREMEQDLRESEARFRMLAENLEEIVWMATPDVEEFIYINPAFEDVWGMDRERLYEDPFSFLEAVHEDDRDHVREQFERLPESDFEDEYRIVRPDGEVRWVYARGTVVTDEGTTRIVGIGEDVTERKERERELERALDLLDRTERIADVGGWEINPETQEVFWTDHVFDLLDVPDGEEPPLEEALDMYHEEDKEAVVTAVEEALETGEPFDVEARIHTAGGELRWLRLQGVPETDADGEVVSFRGAAQDVTEHKERERQLEALVEQLEASNERLEQFAYAASHDLQEPLRMVSSYLQLIEQRYADEFDEDGREFIDFAVDGADRMRAMIEALLQYSRVETRGDPFEPVDLAAVFDDARADLQVKIEETDATVTSGVLPSVEGDRGQLRQLVQNLLENALEYSGEEPPEVHVDAERRDDRWVVSVADEGIGIEPADQDDVFEVFQRLHSRDEHEGTGIGLALCERIVERHGGDIWVESEPGEGSTFSFTLPTVDRDA